MTAFRHLRTGLAALVAAAAMAIGAGAASASTVSQTLSFTDTRSEFLVFKPFDTGLGTLASASIVFSGTATLPEGSITGRTAFGVGGSIAQFTVNYDASFSTSLAGTGRPVIGSSTLCFSGSTPGTCTARYRSVSRPFTVTGSFGDLDDVIGADVRVSLEIRDALSVIIGSRSDGPTSFWTVSGTATLTYTFELATDPSVIPLPAGLPLLLAGLGALGLTARRRRKAA